MVSRSRSIAAYVLTKISVTVAAGGIVFETIMGVDFWTRALAVVLLIGLYTVLGGLKAVLYTDVLQVFVIVAGSAATTLFGLRELGGWEAMRDIAGPAHMSMWKEASHPDFPWTGILLGVPILGVWYWCTDQFIVQRVLSARDIDHARGGAILGGFLKVLPLFVFVIPGVVAHGLAQQGRLVLEQPDRALPDVRRLSHHLVAQGVSASQLTKLISHLNDQLTARLLGMACERYGIAATDFCWLSFGSEGRGEQTIATDQDNGILYVEGRAASERLLELANWTNEALASAGFPLCKGNIMARNPAWCLSFADWDALFGRWIDRGDPEALLNASIFFDFRPLFGETALAQRLRDDVVLRAQRNPRFLKQMSDNALRNRPPASGRLVESLFGEAGPERVDLKMHGTVPFVDAARIWALGSGLSETNTVERFKRLGETGRLPESDVEGWVAAFEFFQLMRLRAQHEREQLYGRDKDDNTNEVELAVLSPLDRRIINESFRQARKLQQRLGLDFPG